MSEGSPNVPQRLGDGCWKVDGTVVSRTEHTILSHLDSSLLPLAAGHLVHPGHPAMPHDTDQAKQLLEEMRQKRMVEKTEYEGEERWAIAECGCLLLERIRGRNKPQKERPQ